MSEDDESFELQLQQNNEIETSQAVWIIEEFLGEGKLGEVWRVRDKRSGRLRAMKVEWKQDESPYKLKVEIAILKLMRSQGQHSPFVEMVDRGKKDDEGFAFIVMQLVGCSLEDLKKKRGSCFSAPTGLSVSLQCLKACEELHKYGFIHRDIRPGNYACGYGKKAHQIFMLNFGFSRKIVNEHNELKIRRIQCPFKGTLTFASVASHREQDLGYKDDCEMWFYLMLDLIVPTGLPWKSCNDTETVRRMKEESRGKEETYEGIMCAEELEKIIHYLDILHYTDDIDYQYIYESLEEACSTCGGNIDDPYDWEKD